MSEHLDPAAGMSPKELRRWLYSDDPSDHPWKSKDAIAEELAQEAELDRLEPQQQGELVTVTLSRTTSNW